MDNMIKPPQRIHARSPNLTRDEANPVPPQAVAKKSVCKPDPIKVSPVVLKLQAFVPHELYKYWDGFGERSYQRKLLA
jgi:hypothetical protein